MIGSLQLLSVVNGRLNRAHTSEAKLCDVKARVVHLVFRFMCVYGNDSRRFRRNLDDCMHDPEEFQSTTKAIVKGHKERPYAYNRNLAYCANCQKTFYGIPPKCPSCASVNMLIFHNHVEMKRFCPSFSNPTQISALNN